MKTTLEDIKKLVDAFAKKINAPERSLPTYGTSADGAHPHIEIDKTGQLSYVIVERGEELERHFAADTDDLLYRVFADVTFEMAISFEGNHRIEGEDFRRQLFAKQEELLVMLRNEWRERKQKEHDWVLRSHPFDDEASRRAGYSKQLSDAGMPAAEAWAEALKKYPEPKPG